MHTTSTNFKNNNSTYMRTMNKKKYLCSNNNRN